MNHFVVYLIVIQHYKSTILQVLKILGKKIVVLAQISATQGNSTCAAMSTAACWASGSLMHRIRVCACSRQDRAGSIQRGRTERGRTGWMRSTPGESLPLDLWAKDFIFLSTGEIYMTQYGQNS